MTLKERLAGPLMLLRELTEASKGDSGISDALIGNAFRHHVLSYRQILNEIEYPVPEELAPHQPDMTVRQFYRDWLVACSHRTCEEDAYLAGFRKANELEYRASSSPLATSFYCKSHAFTGDGRCREQCGQCKVEERNPPQKEPQ